MGECIDKNLWLIRLSEAGRFWRVDFEDLTAPERVFRCVWELEAQVNNGGFDQYFFNSSGDHAFAAVSALLEIGAKRAAEIVERAVALFPDSRPPSEQQGRLQVIDALSEHEKALLTNLDREFYAYPDNLTDLLFDYVLQHRDQIAGIDSVPLEQERVSRISAMIRGCGVSVSIVVSLGSFSRRIPTARAG